MLYLKIIEKNEKSFTLTSLDPINHEYKLGPTLRIVPKGILKNDLESLQAAFDSSYIDPLKSGQLFFFQG